ncbi:MAG: hypothetical protein FWC11_04165 [Firmicutes bacterium]|nr:hypothetical protein [Bacillota bacterium]MCL2256037.1 hypothetical protein [Bacillota bacterium]
MITFHVKSDFKCVYLLNGSFVENPNAVKYSSAEPLYVTALPLSAHLMPYTVKILGKKVLENSELVSVFSVSDERAIVYLRPRYNYVYNRKKIATLNEHDFVESFFYSVKKGNLIKAREAMTLSLMEKVNDENLSAFFADYHFCLKDNFFGEKNDKNEKKNVYLLIDSENTAHSFQFVLESGKIHDIVEG